MRQCSLMLLGIGPPPRLVLDTQNGLADRFSCLWSVPQVVQEDAPVVINPAHFPAEYGVSWPLSQQRLKLAQRPVECTRRFVVASQLVVDLGGPTVGHGHLHL